MTTNIIYHDFQNAGNTANRGTSETTLAKTPLVVKIAPKVNSALNSLCIFLCGACVGISVLALVALSIR